MAFIIGLSPLSDPNRQVFHLFGSEIGRNDFFGICCQVIIFTIVDRDEQG